MGIILDAHFDVLMDILRFRRLGERCVFETRHLPDVQAAGINVLICSVFIEDRFLPEMGLRHALAQIAALREDILDSPRVLELCASAWQARRAIGEGKIAVFLSLEGAEPIGNDLLLLDTFYELGVRLLGLTWSRRNFVADGCSFDWSAAMTRQGGLTKFGREVVARAQELGMVIDVSHINDAGFEDVAKLSSAPFIASHSNCRSLCGSARNLTDEQIEAIAESGGVIGMNAHSPFVSDALGDRTPEMLLAHLEYIGNLVGFDHVGLGLDLCDCLAAVSDVKPRDPLRRDLFANHNEAGRNFIGMISARYAPDVAGKVLGENFFRVLERTLG